MLAGCRCLLLGLALTGVAIDEEQCTSTVLSVRTSSLVQKAAALAHSHVRVDAEEDSDASSERAALLGMKAGQAVPSSKAQHARFLMQATFGPTRDSLAALGATTYEDWIKEQVSLPVESHREYYRRRVNPQFHKSQFVGPSRSPCAKGARWHNYAFTQKDVGRQVKLLGSKKILVDGGLRTDVEEGPLPSSWVGVSNFTGYVCYVKEEVGGEVHIDPSKRCRKRTVMPNPAIWLAQGAGDLPLSLEALKPGVVVLRSSPASCTLDAQLQQKRLAGEGLVVRAGGKYYRFDSRMELLENTVGSPAQDASACVPRTFLNEQSCELPNFSSGGNATVQGLRAQVMKMDGQSMSGTPYTELIDPQVNHPEASMMDWPGFPYMMGAFGVRWTGTLSVQEAGEYEFSLQSDDGSKLTIDDQLIVSTDRRRRRRAMREGKSSATLAPGGHAVTIDYVQNGGSLGMMFSWKGPDSKGEMEVVPSSALSAQPPSWSGCFLACGSPGEVANDPSVGHHLAMWTTDDRATRDIDYDNRYVDRMDSALAKSTAWTMKALDAKDQLRQRVAWALSQIFVVSTQGVGDNHLTEMWLNFYDIFVRHAFGNFRDILKEVSYSPLMGMYLTHTGSSSYAYNGRFPNENYAREIMQLFTIGLDKLNPDGSVQIDAQGRDVPTYDTEHIMNFARVFTGFVEQPPRANVEYRGRSNMIDPMRVVAERHDVFPKPDLDGNYLGDGLPLCAEAAVAGAFLAKGARYSFHGVHGPEGALDLSPGSALFGELCAAREASKCKFRTAVELPRTLRCAGAECGAGGVGFVKVGAAYYEYVPPTCVHMAFPGPTAREGGGGGNSSLAAQQGYCLNAEGKSLGRGTRLDSLDAGDSATRREACVAKCRGVGATGCLLIWGRSGQGCYAHFGEVARGNGRDRYLCWAFNETGLLGHAYAKLPKDRLCPAGTEITSMAECRQSFRALGLSTTRGPWVSRLTEKRVPTGCSFGSGRLHWSIGAAGQRRGHLAPVCRAHVVLDDEGKLVQADGQTKFSVPWLAGGPPPPGAHLVRAETRQAFDRTPSRAELLAKLRVGAPKPEGGCSECGGEVKAYQGGGSSIGPDTVFELDGRYLKNTESIVSLVDGPQAFRNPPVFLRSTSDPGADRAAVAEVEALLDHLFHHQNTPVFIGRRFIQRFVTSNPSPKYVEAVGRAFSTGAYGGLTFSGEYGDLAATVAAVLLHPEARGQAPTAGANATLHGSLREPLLKFIHMMRSMEYQDKAHGHVVFSELQDVIGQFPYQSPTVFNFYMADYELPMPEPEPESEPEPEPEPEMKKPEPEPEVEPEPEPEPEPPVKPPVSPEFQIFTPPLFVGYLNGMSSLVKSGVSGQCDGGRSLGVGVREMRGGRWANACPQGSLTWQGRGGANATLEEMDLLLTGGRLTPAARQVVQAAYEQAPPGEELQAAQQAVAMTAEFNTQGAPLPLPGRRPFVVGGEAPTRKPYKAVVMLFLSGGADTFNMLVPQECDLYQEYRSIRTDLALNPNELLKISTTGQACESFGIHARFSFLKGLYDKGQAAFVSNVGALVEPTTKERLRQGTAQRCFGLFSHSDQQNAAQTLKCQDMGTSARGAGGRVADALAAGSQKFHTTSFSLAGSAIWPQGVTTQRDIVGQRGGHGFHEYERWREAISNITAQRHGNAYSEAYARAFLDSIQNTVTLGRTLQGVELKTKYPERTRLDRELQQVAKLIASREARHAERDFFFVSLGGWDMHSMMKQRLDSRFRDIDAALRGFVAEMEAQGVWERVALATESEFGRTLDSNGGGSDHAWAGNHFIISGGLKGGRVFNKFPSSLKAGNDRDLGRGRLIPEFPWESMMVPMAEWMGMDPSQRTDTFPNIGYFNSSHIIAENDLFKS